MDPQKFEFELKVYETAIQTYNSLADRVSLRFNIILTGDIALAGFFIHAWLQDKFGAGNGSFLFLIVGLILSLFLYFQSAQDKYILKHQISRINEIKTTLRNELGLVTFPCLFDALDETDNIDQHPRKSFIFENIASWRSNFFSITKIPSLISLFFFVFWLIVVFINL